MRWNDDQVWTFARKLKVVIIPAQRTSLSLTSDCQCLFRLVLEQINGALALIHRAKLELLSTLWCWVQLVSQTFVLDSDFLSVFFCSLQPLHILASVVWKEQKISIAARISKRRYSKFVLKTLRRVWIHLLHMLVRHWQSRWHLVHLDDFSPGLMNLEKSISHVIHTWPDSSLKFV